MMAIRPHVWMTRHSHTSTHSHRTSMSVFFRGAEIADPAELLEGTGKYMRYVRLRPDGDVDATALMALIDTAYTDMKGRLEAG